MRIISVVKRVGIRRFPGDKELSVHMTVTKILFGSYMQALYARADLRKYFGKMEIKRLKGGYGLYTRKNSLNTHFYRNRRRKTRSGPTNSPIGVRFGGRGQH